MLSTTNRLATLPAPFEAVCRDFRRGLNGNGNGRSFVAGDLAPMTLWRDEGHVFVEVDVPGLSHDELDVTLENGKLIIRGERKRPPHEAICRHEERCYGEFQRIVALDDAVDPDSIDARLANGVLHITLSIKPELQPRRIDVRHPAGTPNN